MATTTAAQEAVSQANDAERCSQFLVPALTASTAMKKLIEEARDATHANFPKAPFARPTALEMVFGKAREAARSNFAPTPPAI
jgi:hypothetical protein